MSKTIAQSLTLIILLCTPRASMALTLPIPTRAKYFPLSRPHDLGTVIGWGSNSGGETNMPVNLGKCVAVAAGTSFSLALRPDGTVVAWGTNNFGQCLVPPGLSNVVAITAGSFGAAALMEDGTFVQWGYIPGGPPPLWLHDIVQISAGQTHMLALRIDGSVVGWGDNGNREIDIPAEAANAVIVSAAPGSSAALTADGRVVVWGLYTIQSPKIYGPGYVGVGQAGGVKLRDNGFVEGMIVENFVQGDILAVSRGGNIAAAIFNPSRFIWIENKGIVYRAVNTIAISAGASHVLGLLSVGPSVPAVGIAKVVNGFVVGIDVVSGGNNYDYVPVVNIAGGGGTGAIAIARVVDGVVTGFTVTNAGHDYFASPTVQISSPWFEPSVTVTTNVTRFKVTADLIPGEQYVLDTSSDLVNWTSAPFSAATNLFSFPVETAASAGFIRLGRK